MLKATIFHILIVGVFISVLQAQDTDKENELKPETEDKKKIEENEEKKLKEQKRELIIMPKV